MPKTLRRFSSCFSVTSGKQDHSTFSVFCPRTTGLANQLDIALLHLPQYQFRMFSENLFDRMSEIFRTIQTVNTSPDILYLPGTDSMHWNWQKESWWYTYQSRSTFLHIFCNKRNFPVGCFASSSCFWICRFCL